MSDVTPAESTITAMMMALKYSMRPNPKGCFLSAGRCESFVPTMVMTLESASLRLFTASITMATELAKTPTPALNAANNTLAMMPIQLVLIICEDRSIFFLFSLVFLTVAKLFVTKYQLIYSCLSITNA